MTRQKDKSAQSATIVTKIDAFLDKASHAAAADLAKLHLRNDKDLNAAYPLDEKNPPPKSSK